MSRTLSGLPVGGPDKLIYFGMKMKTLLIFLLLACSFSFGAMDAAAIQEGETVPEIVLPRPDGKYIQVSSYKGNIVVLFFWSTWCSSCKQELPVLNRVLREYRKVVIFGITNEGAPQVKSFMRANPLPFQVLLDTESSVFKSFGVVSIPTTIVVDRTGMIKKTFPSDEMKYKDLKQVLDTIR